MENTLPKGQPKAGFRKRRGTSAAAIKRKEALYTRPQLVVSNETDSQIDARISSRFEILETLTNATIVGDSRALIVSGPAGLGKSYTVEDCLKQTDPNGINYTIIKGYVKTTGLYKTLWQYRNKGQVIVFDDADSIFYDDVSLNMLKAVCDTNDTRKVSYLADYTLIDSESAEKIPNSFDFEGSIIFITNLDFDHMVDRGHKLAPHLSALISRSHYVDLSLKSKRDYIIRIKQAIAAGLLDKVGLEKNETREVVEFITTHSDSMRELSLRSALKIAALRKTSANKWKNIATVTCLKNGSY